MKGLKEQLLKRFRSRWKEGKNGYVNSQTIQDWAHKNVIHKKKGASYKHETVGRQLRSLAEEGHLERFENNSVYYKYIPTSHERLSMIMNKKIYG